MASPVLDQLVAVRLLERADEVIGERRRQLRRQRDALLAALAEHLPGWSYTLPQGGMCLWVELDAPVSTALAHAALARGVRIAPGPRFGVDGTLERFLRVPYTLPEPQLREAVTRLAAATTELGQRLPTEWTTPLVA
jgi:DNA-binding transcriptional MocR family regulator